MLLDRVLFIGAHADDVELFAGGLLHRLCREGGKATVLTFSSHRGVTDHEKTAREYRRNMESLGCEAFLFDFGACGGEFQARRDEIYQSILQAARMAGPTLAVTHQPDDTNQDHQQVRAEVLRSLKGICSIVGGEYPLNQVSGPVPGLLVELSREDIDAKLRLINGYESQRAPHRRYFDGRVWEGLARMRGAQIGKEFAEGFFVERLIL